MRYLASISFLKMNILLPNALLIALLYRLHELTRHSLEIFSGESCKSISIIPDVILRMLSESK
jgi:hypothetical protein